MKINFFRFLSEMITVKKKTKNQSVLPTPWNRKGRIAYTKYHKNINKKC